MTNITFTATDEQILNAFAKQVSYKKLSEIYKKVSSMYDTYSIDLELAADLVQIVYENYIKSNYKDSDIPEILKPLVIKATVEAIKTDKALYNEDKENLPGRTVKAIEYCTENFREDQIIVFGDLVEAFEDGYLTRDKEETIKPLSKYSDEELLNELLKRKK